jgi:hypothetical protein
MNPSLHYDMELTLQINNCCGLEDKFSLLTRTEFDRTSMTHSHIFFEE